MSDAGGPTETRAFLRRPEELVEGLRDGSMAPDPAVPDDLVRELRSSRTRMRAAAEQLQTEQLRVARLLETGGLSPWMHERLLGTLPVPALTCDDHGRIQIVNSACAQLIGRRAKDLEGVCVLTLVTTRDRATVRRLMGTEQPGRLTLTVGLVRPEPAGSPLASPAIAEPGVDVAAEPVTTEGRTTWLVLVTGGARRGEHDRLARSLSDLARLPPAHDDRQDLLRRAVLTCRAGLGADVEVGLVLGPPSEPSAVGTTDASMQALDGAQLHAEEGPAVTAFVDQRTVVVDDMSVDQRWPRLRAVLAAEAAADRTAHPLRSVVAVPLVVEGQQAGVLSVGRVEPQVGAWLPGAAELVARGVEAALQEWQVHRDLDDLTHDLRRALASRAVIDQAKGVVMAELGVDAEDAFRHLVRLSNERGVKLRVVAEQIVANTGRRRAR